MPAHSDIQRRDRALIAFTLLTGARDSAVASMKLKHVNLAESYVEQDAREVHTKFSSTFRTYFFPVGDDIQQTVADWVTFLQEKLLWGNDDPILPATHISLGPLRQFEAVGLARSHWRSATRIRIIFRDAFTSAGLPYFNPHCFRHTLARLGQAICLTPEDFKAWSQNLGHEKVMTTFSSYGQVEDARQGEIIRGLAKPRVLKHAYARELADRCSRERCKDYPRAELCPRAGCSSATRLLNTLKIRNYGDTSGD